jgi:hypothetical protein
VLVPKPTQHVDVGGAGQAAGEVQLPVGPCDGLPATTATRAAAGRGCPGRRQGTGGVDAGLGDLEPVRSGVVGAYPAAAIRLHASNTAPEDGAPIARVMSPTFINSSGSSARYAATCGYRCPVRRPADASGSG